MHCSRIQLKHARWTMNTQHLRSFCANLRSIRADVCHRLSIILQIVPSVRIVCGHWWMFHPLFRRGNHLRDFSWVEVIIVSVYIFDTERKVFSFINVAFDVFFCEVFCFTIHDSITWILSTSRRNTLHKKRDHRSLKKIDPNHSARIPIDGGAFCRDNHQI